VRHSVPRAGPLCRSRPQRDRAPKAGSREWPHLRCCQACRQDYLGLLAAVEGLPARRVCEVSDVRTRLLARAAAADPGSHAALCPRWAASSVAVMVFGGHV